MRNLEWKVTSPRFSDGLRLAQALLFLAFAIPAPAGPGAVNVSYALRELGNARWEYTYTVENVSLAVPLEEFTIYFDADDYASLVRATLDPPASLWDELVIQPEPALHDPGFYDALSLTGGIPAGGFTAGFRVQFEWRGLGQPAAQPFEVVDPDTFATLYSGSTVPEPAALLGLLVGGLAYAPGRRRSSPAGAR